MSETQVDRAPDHSDQVPRTQAVNHDAARTLRVCLVVDDEFREHSGWRARARSLLAEASDAMAEQVGLALAIEVWRNWESPDEARELYDFERPVRTEFRQQPVDLILVLSAQASTQKRTDDSSGKGWSTNPRGLADFYDPIAFVRLDPPGPDSWPYGVETIVHEIAHCFGAWHAPGERCVMTMYKRGAPTLRLCATTRRVFELTRRMDLRLGPGQLPTDVRDELIARWRAECPDDVSNPVAQGYLNRAHLLELDGTGTDERLDCYRTAIALFHDDDRGPDVNRALAHRMYGQALAKPDPLRARPHLRVAAEMYAALKQDTERVAGPTLQLSWVELRLGSPERAERLSRDALARRTAAHGRLHEQTAEGYDFHGRALAALGRTEDAHAAFTSAESIYDELGGYDEKRRSVQRRLGRLSDR